MCSPDVVVRPYIARQSDAPRAYVGHAGIEHWVASLDAQTHIKLELLEVHVTGPQSAVVGTNVWLESGDSRTGGETWSVWRFDDGKLLEAVGFGTRAEALAAEGAEA
jgi:ketosteroid isomerase-like protein